MIDKFAKFIDNIIEIEGKLILLYKDSEDLFDNLVHKNKEINFHDKDSILLKYENLLVSLSHEMEGQIGYLRQKIIVLDNFFQFRAKYSNFSDKTLCKIIDNEMTIIEKKETFKEINAKEIIEKIKEIKQEWKKSFKNASYKIISESIK